VITSLTTTYHWVWIINSRKITRWCQGWRFQVSLQSKNISGTYLISITSLPEDEQTSKHGGGRRYNAILEFKGEQIKIWERERKKKRRKKKNISMCKNKMKWTPRFSKVHQEFQGLKIKRSKLIFPTMCNPITRTSFVPRDHSLPFQVCVFFSSPPWHNIIFQWPFWWVSVRPWEACLVLTTSHL
jgi:hypothetical protein